MRPAQDELNEALAELNLRAPAIPVVANTSGLPLTTVEDIREELERQLCSCVYWQRSVEYMAAQGVDRFVEIGPGNVLTGLVKRIARGAAAVSVADLDGLSALT